MLHDLPEDSVVSRDLQDPFHESTLTCLYFRKRIKHDQTGDTGTHYAVGLSRLKSLERS